MTNPENVSRETLTSLEHYASILRKWNPKINLVAKSTLEDLWERHIVDSLQLVEHIPEGTRSLVDMGSGGGFPGLVVAIDAQGRGWPKSVTLIESDQRKSAFLRTVLRETQTQAEVLTERIEHAQPQNADVVTARALADLTLLVGYAQRHLAPNGKALFLKGRNWKEEVKAAEQIWKFRWNAIESQTSPEAVLLEVGEISRV